MALKPLERHKGHVLQFIPGRGIAFGARYSAGQVDAHTLCAKIERSAETSAQDVRGEGEPRSMARVEVLHHDDVFIVRFACVVILESVQMFLLLATNRAGRSVNQAFQQLLEV